MRRSVSAPIKIKSTIVALLLLCTIAFFGCGPKQPPTLYIYCNETFWYVMQEEGIFFNKAYGFRVILVPIRAPRTSNEVLETIEIDGDPRAPAQWRSMPELQTLPQDVEPHSQIHPEIKRQIDRIAEEKFADLFLSDSKRQLEQLQITALSTSEFPICYLTLAILVPRGNPHQIRSIKDALESSRRLGIVEPSIDGLGESSWEVLEKIAGGASAIPMELVQLYERQYDLLEALEQGKIDAALVWNATSHTNFLLAKYADEYNTKFAEDLREAERRRQKGNREVLQEVIRKIAIILVQENSFAEEVPLTDNPDEHHVVAVWLVALSSTSNYGYCKRFADFMRSNQGKEILRRFKFVTE